MNPRITIESARVGTEPELKYTAAGMAICNLSVVTSDRKKQDDGTWADVNPTWFRCTAFKTLAENVAESIHKGDVVIIVGKISQRDWEKDGEKRTSHQEIAIDSIGPSLQWNTVSVNRAKRGSSTGETTGGNQDTVDPWDTKPAGASGTAGPLPEDPPF